MTIDIAWYEVASQENMHISLLTCVFVGLIVTLFFLEKLRYRLLFVSLMAWLFFISAYADGRHALQNLESLDGRLATYNQWAEHYSMPVRKEVLLLVTELSRAKQADFYYIGDLRATPEFFMLNHFVFMTDDEVRVFKKFVEHCYSDDLVKTLWKDQLSGYPIHQDEARTALTYAEAQSSDVTPECLGTTASLLFLK